MMVRRHITSYFICEGRGYAKEKISTNGHKKKSVPGKKKNKLKEHKKKTLWKDRFLTFVFERCEIVSTDGCD